MTEAAYHRELERGDVLDEAYRVVRLIAQGGMGHVYEAEQLRLDRRVALKILSVDPKKSGEFLPRFRREAEICAKLAHPNIIAVLDWNVAHGMPYLVMEYLEGEDLGMRIHRGPLELDEALYVLDGVAAGLVAAHLAGVVHRDLKPSNIFLCNVGMSRPHVKLLDFGVSKVAWETTLSTTSPKVLGSPRYMAPEQARGESNVDARVDQFALGTVAYEMFAGAFAFDGDSLSSVLYRVVHEPPAPLENRAPHLPAHVVRSIARAMAKNPADRFENVAQFMQAMRGEVAPDIGHTPEARTAQFKALDPEPVILTAKANKDLSPRVPAAPTQLGAPQLHAVKHRFATRTVIAIAALAIVLAVAIWRVGPRLVADDETHLTEPAPTTTASPPPPPGPPPPTTLTGGQDTAEAKVDHVPEKRSARKTGQRPEPRGHDTAETPSVEPPFTPTGGPNDAGDGSGGIKTTPETRAQVQRLIAEAQKLYDAGDYRETVVRARQVFGYQDAPRAHVLIVLAYCHMGSVGDAHAEMFSVRPQDKPGVIAACAKLDVDVSD